jgi:hypothetical protein
VRALEVSPASPDDGAAGRTPKGLQAEARKEPGGGRFEVMRTADHRKRRGVTMQAAIPTARELDHRETDGLEVTLLWYQQEDYASVVVADSKTGEAFELVLGAGDSALDVFHHPFAYAAHRGLEYGSRVTEAEYSLAV